MLDVLWLIVSKWIYTCCILVAFWGEIWNTGVLTVQETAVLLLSVYSCKQEQDKVIQRNLHDSLRRRLTTKSRACYFYLCFPGWQHFRCGDNLWCSSQDETFLRKDFSFLAVSCVSLALTSFVQHFWVQRTFVLTVKRGFICHSVSQLSNVWAPPAFVLHLRDTPWKASAVGHPGVSDTAHSVLVWIRTQQRWALCCVTRPAVSVLNLLHPALSSVLSLIRWRLVSENVK